MHGIACMRFRFDKFLVGLLFSSLISWQSIHAQNNSDHTLAPKTGNASPSQNALLLTDLGIEMLLMPAGHFKMGSDSGDPNERPVHPVEIESFYLSKYEVSFRQWDMCVTAGGCSYSPSDATWGRGERPVVLVAWDEAKVFIGWLNEQTASNFRLPSEAEWEYAARAGSTSQYTWGEQINCSMANYGKENGQCGLNQQTVAIGRYAANAFGLHDMHGNVSEWVEDCYQTNYIQASPTGKANTKIGCGYRVLRGGSWLNRAENLRSARRIWYQPEIRYNSFGFRLAMDLNPQ